MKHILLVVLSLLGGLVLAAEPTKIVVAPMCDESPAFDQTGTAIQYYINGYLAGCDPIAWSQVITYHALTHGFPRSDWKPTPQTNYVCVGNDWAQRTTMTGEYEWSKIATSTMNTTGILSPVGRLVYDLGVIGGASYQNGETMGTIQLRYDIEAPSNFKRYFLDNGKTFGGYYFNEKLSDEDLETALIANLRARAPVIFNIRYGTGGHMIVCDGYGVGESGKTLYHMDYGWGGNGNCWVDLAWIQATITALSLNIVPEVAPNGANGILAGVVRDHGAPLGGVGLALYDGKTLIAETKSDDAGTYAFTGLKTETLYTVQSEAYGAYAAVARTVSLPAWRDVYQKESETAAWEETHDKSEPMPDFPLLQGNLLLDLELGRGYRFSVR